jgi:uncharacterized protein (UPF0276 family)
VTKLATNYSAAAATLLDAGWIAPDVFKCPAWPGLLATLRGRYPLYVHFPLRAGAGRGEPVDTETQQAPDWHAVETLLAESSTPFVNVHLAPSTADHPDIPRDTTDPAHAERLAACLIRDVRPVVARFGAERVIVENDDVGMRPVLLPELVRRVVAATGCGFLLDLSHARLAARTVGIDDRDYLRALPIAQVREVHLSGIRTFDAAWVAVLQQAGIDAQRIQRLAGRRMDHLPLTDNDWDFTAWALDYIRQQARARPWVVTLEYGGVGPLWEALTDADVLAEQVPRLQRLVAATLTTTA